MALDLHGRALIRGFYGETTPSGRAAAYYTEIISKSFKKAVFFPNGSCASLSNVTSLP
jgi:hypothetical protein